MKGRTFTVARLSGNHTLFLHYPEAGIRVQSYGIFFIIQ